MRCSQFRSHYSTFRDGLITDPVLLTGMEQHLAACPDCTRYHSSVARGVDLLKGSAAIEPSPDFGRRLRGRLRAQTSASAPVLPAPASVAAALMFAAGLALLAYEGAARGSATGPNALAAATPRAIPKSVSPRPAAEPPAVMPYAASTPHSTDPDLTLTAFRTGPAPAPAALPSEWPIETLASVSR